MQSKEEEALSLIKEIEASREIIMGEKDSLQVAIEEKAALLSNMEMQLQSMRADSESTINSRILELETERDNALAQYSTILSEKGMNVA